ncbi:hypothetical protein [uncultured Sphaerochaeta sp.]|uniref:hypothetical protein n=1 Tax=uncultured Sphaerochaeta sp. TaxID=886478 RepID=UPI002A0A82B7|nr:hypothetical protein [uncultured Sphaerochaeta sp.]
MGSDDKTVVFIQKTGTVEIRSGPFFLGATIHVNGVNYGQVNRKLSNMPAIPIYVHVSYGG